MFILPLHRRASHIARGVTFVELMVVIFILMLLVGVSVPTMLGVYRRSQLSAAARELASLARLARQRAVLTGHHTELEVDQDKGTYRLILTPEDPRQRIRTSASPNPSPMERTRTLAEGGSRVRFLRADSAVTEHRGSEPVKILFYRNGTATPATIVLADDKKRQMTVQVIGATGDVRLGAGSPESLLIPVVTPAAAIPAAVAETSPRPSAPPPPPSAAGSGLRIKNRGEPAGQR